MTENEAIERALRDVNDWHAVQGLAMPLKVLSQRYGKCIKNRSIGHVLAEDPRFVVKFTETGKRIVASVSYIETVLMPYVAENKNAIFNWWQGQGAVMY